MIGLGILAYACLGCLFLWQFSNHYSGFIELHTGRLFVTFVLLWPLFVSFWIGMQIAYMCATVVGILAVLFRETNG